MIILDVFHVDTVIHLDASCSDFGEEARSVAGVELAKLGSDK